MSGPTYYKKLGTHMHHGLLTTDIVVDRLDLNKLPDDVYKYKIDKTHIDEFQLFDPSEGVGKRLRIFPKSRNLEDLLK